MIVLAFIIVGLVAFLAWVSFDYEKRVTVTERDCESWRERALASTARANAAERRLEAADDLKPGNMLHPSGRPKRGPGVARLQHLVDATADTIGAKVVLTRAEALALLAEVSPVPDRAEEP